MESRFKILRKTINEMRRSGTVKNYYSDSHQDTIHPSYNGVAKEVAADLLDAFPKEDNEHVEAYRALMTLVEYAEKHELKNTGDELYRNEDSLALQLLNIRHRIEEPAREKIIDRLEIDATEAEFGNAVATTIFDPVSKISHNITFAEQDPDIERRKEHTAHQVLQTPL